MEATRTAFHLTIVTWATRKGIEEHSRNESEKRTRRRVLDGDASDLCCRRRDPLGTWSTHLVERFPLTVGLMPAAVKWILASALLAVLFHAKAATSSASAATSDLGAPPISLQRLSTPSRFEHPYAYSTPAGAT